MGRYDVSFYKKRKEGKKGRKEKIYGGKDGCEEGIKERKNTRKGCKEGV